MNRKPPLPREHEGVLLIHHACHSKMKQEFPAAMMRSGNEQMKANLDAVSKLQAGAKTLQNSLGEITRASETLAAAWRNLPSRLAVPSRGRSAAVSVA